MNSDDFIFEELFDTKPQGKSKNTSALNTTSPSKLAGTNKAFSKVTYSDKSTFKGQISHNNVPDGIGRLELENGDFYEGEFKDGMFDGKGRLKMKDGKLYEGTWSMNMREGQGKELWLDGKSYEGSFKRDQKNGYGKKPLPKLTPRCLQVARWKLIHRLLQRR